MEMNFIQVYDTFVCIPLINMDDIRQQKCWRWLKSDAIIVL